MTAKTGICLVVLWFGSSLWAQEVRFLDFTSVQPRTQLRYPPPPPPDCSLPQSCVTGGSFGSSIADGAPDRRDPHALAVIPEKVVPTNITLDPFQVEFRVLNTGLAPIDIPISSRLSDLQPADDSQPFSYLSIALVVLLDSIKGPQASGLGYVELYGATDHAGTIVKLKPGQWIRIKETMKLHTWPTVAIDGLFRGSFWLRQNIFKPHPGGAFTETVNLYPNQSSFPGIEVRFAPTRSSLQQPASPQP